MLVEIQKLFEAMTFFSRKEQRNCAHLNDAVAQAKGTKICSIVWFFLIVFLLLDSLSHAFPYSRGHFCSKELYRLHHICMRRRSNIHVGNKAGDAEKLVHV